MTSESPSMYSTSVPRIRLDCIAVKQWLDIFVLFKFHAFNYSVWCRPLNGGAVLPPASS